MNPKVFSARLRSIASAIDASRHPVRFRVAQDVRRLLVRISSNVSWDETLDEVLKMFRENPVASDDAVTSDMMGGNLERLNNEYGMMISLVSDGNGLGVQVSFEGDAEVIWTGSVPDFNDSPELQAKVAEDVVENMKNMLEFDD